MRITIPLFLCLATLTLLAHIHARQYDIIGEELLANPDFNQGLAGWDAHPAQNTITTSGEGVLLENHDPAKSVALHQKITAAGAWPLLLLQGATRTEEVIPGKNLWNQGRVLIAGLNGAGKWLPGSREALACAGSNGWRRFAHPFPVPDGAKEILVRIELNQATGILRAKELSLHRAQKIEGYSMLRWTMLSAWGVFLLVLARPYCQAPGKTRLLSLLVPTVALLILIGATMPGTQKKLLLHQLSTFFQHLSAFPPTLLLTDLSKIGHFAGFSLLAFIARLSRVPARSGWLFADLCLLAGASECMQYFSVDRTPLVGDVIIDSLGGLLGIIIATIFLKFPSYLPAKTRS